jgi:putative membrane protein
VWQRAGHAVLPGTVQIVAYRRLPTAMTWLGDRLRIDDVGEEPDYRYSLANERTFLAWIRTALAVMAAAVAVVQLVSSSDLHGLRRELGVALAVLGLIISAAAFPRWFRNQRAMRLRQPLGRSVLLPVVGVVLTLVGVAVLVISLAG